MSRPPALQIDGYSFHKKNKAVKEGKSISFVCKHATKRYRDDINCPARARGYSALRNGEMVTVDIELLVDHNQKCIEKYNQVQLKVRENDVSNLMESSLAIQFNPLESSMLSDNQNYYANHKFMYDPILYQPINVNNQQKTNETMRIYENSNQENLIYHYGNRVFKSTDDLSNDLLIQTKRTIENSENSFNEQKKRRRN